MNAIWILLLQKRILTMPMNNILVEIDVVDVSIFVMLHKNNIKICKYRNGWFFG